MDAGAHLMDDLRRIVARLKQSVAGLRYAERHGAFPLDGLDRRDQPGASLGADRAGVVRRDHALHGGRRLISSRGWRATRVGPDVLLIDFRLDQPREIAQRLLPAEVTGLIWNGIR